MNQDGDLAPRVRARDPEALATLVMRYTQDVYAVAAAVLGAAAAQEIEDAAADAFLAAWKGAASYDPSRAPLRGWLLMHARYAALEHRRQGQRHSDTIHRTAAAAFAALPRLLPSEERLRVQEALAGLTPDDRQVIYRRYFLDQDGATIGRVMGLSRTAVHNRLSRARQRLRQLLSEQPDTPEGGTGHGP